MAGYPVEEGLEHTLSAGDHCGILLCLCLLDGIVTNRLLGGYGRDYEGGVKLSKVEAE